VTEQKTPKKTPAERAERQDPGHLAGVGQAEAIVDTLSRHDTLTASGDFLTTAGHGLKNPHPSRSYHVRKSINTRGFASG